MSLASGYVGLDYIMDVLYQEYGFPDVSEEDVAELLWRGINHIGVPDGFIVRHGEIVINNHKGQLPYDFYELMDGGIRDKATKTGLTRSSDIFHNENADSNNTVEVVGDYDPATGSSYETVVFNENSPAYYSYKIEGGIITTGIKDGTLEIVYRSFPMDDNTGMPKIPRDEVYIAGLVDFVAYHIGFKMMLKDKLSERKFNYIAQRYAFSIGKAKSKAIIPDKERMESLRNQWKSPGIHYTHFETGFGFLGKRL